MDIVVVDSNLLVLLVVGSADKAYISLHKNTDTYSVLDFEIVQQAISLFSEIVLLPHIMTEVSSLARQIRNPARRLIQSQIRTLVETCGELYVPSRDAARRPDYDEYGLTDACILELCALRPNGLTPYLLTDDNPLASRAEILGLNVLPFEHLR